MQKAGSTGVTELDGAQAASAEWIVELEGRLGWRDRHKVFQALIATLHALRDCLPQDEAVYLGTEFPVLLRASIMRGGTRASGR